MAFGFVCPDRIYDQNLRYVDPIRSLNQLLDLLVGQMKLTLCCFPDGLCGRDCVVLSQLAFVRTC